MYAYIIGPQAVSDYNANALGCGGKPEAEKEQVLLHQIQVLFKLLPACNRATLVRVVEMCEKVRRAGWVLGPRYPTF